MPAPPLYRRPLPYQHRLERRRAAAVDLLVIHCTELPDLVTARSYGETIHYPESQTGNAGHFYIDRDGRIEAWVDPDRVAHHVRGFNARSIGIELVNRGRFPEWLHTDQQNPDEPYPDAQINALIELARYLCEQFPGLTRVAGHEDLDTERVPASNDPHQTVRRKRDPGPRFPWARLLDAVPLQRLSPDRD
ncbi:N-acetylmuramoyl-L-alanine amidase [Elongatibacter sediminis]|uniref:N-acetylmuramoyl-L-alanine amidase n=1 Tax=Elongatibacter sediminis TaxID=3119006 RepID=A0AAW9RA33_9GAMM